MELTLRVFAVYQTPIGETCKLHCIAVIDGVCTVWAFLVSIPVRYLVSWLDFILSPSDDPDDEDDKVTFHAPILCYISNRNPVVPGDAP